MSDNAPNATPNPELVAAILNTNFFPLFSDALQPNPYPGRRVIVGLGEGALRVAWVVTPHAGGACTLRVDLDPFTDLPAGGLNVDLIPEALQDRALLLGGSLYLQGVPYGFGAGHWHTDEAGL